MLSFKPYQMDGRNRIHILTRDHMGTNLTREITGKFLTQLSDKFSWLIWYDKGKF